MIEIIIPVKPMPKQSFKFTKAGLKYQPAEIRQYIRTLRYYAIKQYRGKMLTAPLAVRIVFTMPPLQSFSNKRLLELETSPEYHIKRPDVDNLTKPILDAMTGILWQDDSIISCMIVEKYIGAAEQISITVYDNLPKSNLILNRIKSLFRLLFGQYSITKKKGD